MRYFLSIVSAVSLAIILTAPALKLRFNVTDVFVYFVPFGVYCVCLLFANLVMLEKFFSRLRTAALYLFVLAGPFLAFYVGAGQNIDLLNGLVINAALGMAVIMYPWDLRSMHFFVLSLAVLRAIVAMTTILFYGSDEQLAEFQGDEITSYLQTSFFMGAGVICATYLVVRSLSPVSITLFAMCWLGLGVGRGRGALIFCILISLVYLIAALSSRIARFNRLKKLTVIVLIASFVPVIYLQTTKVARYGESLTRIFTNLEVEADEGGRGIGIRTAVNQIREAPIIGNGLGAYRENPINYPHNMFLQWGADSGLFGMVMLGIFWLCVFRATVVGISISDETSLNLVYAGTALSVYVLMHYLKSGDAYIGRDIHIMAPIPLAVLLALGREQLLSPKRRRRRRRRPGSAS